MERLSRDASPYLRLRLSRDASPYLGWLSKGWAFQLIEPCLRDGADVFGFGAEGFGEASNDVRERGLMIFLEIRDQAVTDAVARDVRGKVGGVFAPGEAMGAGIGAQLGFREGEQGANELNASNAFGSSIAGPSFLGGRKPERRGASERHPDKPLRTGAAEEAEEEVFELIVRVVGEGDGRDFMAASRAGEEAVADGACGHFHGEFFGASEGANIAGIGSVCLADGAGEAELGGELLDVALVGGAGGAAEAVVEVGDVKLPAVPGRELGKEMEQDNGVQTAGDRDEQALARGEKGLGEDEVLGLLAEIGHGALSVCQ